MSGTSVNNVEMACGEKPDSTTSNATILMNKPRVRMPLVRMMTRNSWRLRFKSHSTNANRIRTPRNPSQPAATGLFFMSGMKISSLPNTIVYEIPSCIITMNNKTRTTIESDGERVLMNSAISY